MCTNKCDLYLNLEDRFFYFSIGYFFSDVFVKKLICTEL